MAGNAIAWKKHYVDSATVQQTNPFVELLHLFRAFRLMILADRAENLKHRGFSNSTR